VNWGYYGLQTFHVKVETDGGDAFGQSIFLLSPLNGFFGLECPTTPWNQGTCNPWGDLVYTYYTISLYPLYSGPACQTLYSAIANGTLWNLSPQFAQFVGQYGQLYVCPFETNASTTYSVANLFAGNSVITSDPTATLNALSASITNTLEADQ
jgi:hypothetical protein